MDTLLTAVQIGVCVLIPVAAVASVAVVWRDDHKWTERNRGAGPVTEPGPYPLKLQDLAPRPSDTVRQGP